jgi:hypothetical protein
VSKLFAFIIALTTMCGGSALAAPMCTTDTLASYISLGSTGCEIGGGTFSGFQVLPAITGAVPITPENISITPVQSGNMLGVDVMISATAMTGELRQALLGYMLMAPSITGSMITVSGTSTTGGAFVSDIQNYCAGGAFLPGDVTGCNGSTDDALVVLNAGSQSATFPAVTKISIVHDFTLDASSGGSATGGMVMDRFTVASTAPIPEPQTYVLMSSALLAIALRAGFRNRAKQAKVLTGGRHAGF